MARATLNDVLRVFFSGKPGDHDSIDAGLRAVDCKPWTDLSAIRDLIPRPVGADAATLAWTTPFTNAAYLVATRATAVAPGTAGPQIFAIRRVFLDETPEQDVARLVDSFGGRYAGNDHEDAGQRYALWIVERDDPAVRIDGYRLFSTGLVGEPMLLERISVSAAA